MPENVNPTEEQLEILSRVKNTTDNLMIKALAGTGKTSTIVMAEAVSTIKPILYLVFNRNNAEHARKVIASTTKASTFNSLGHGIWAKSIGRTFKPEPKKTADLYRAMIDDAKKPLRSQMWDSFWPVVEGVAKAKSLGYIPSAHPYHKKSLCTIADVTTSLDEAPDDFTWTMIEAVLLKSIVLASSGTCDFDDQIYMPTLFGGISPEFPVVMVDEYQDLNPINHAMITKLAKHRLIGVGDPNQSIYAFRGANSAGMAEAVTRHNMTECDLTVSFRCPEAIVRHVHWHVPKFTWSKRGGSVYLLNSLNIADCGASTTFICRNNAPLLSLAMRCLAGGHSVNVNGSGIGPKIIRQMKKLGPYEMTRSQVHTAISEWLAAREDKGSKTASDIAACMRIFADQSTNLSQALLYAEHLFKQEGQLFFTTGHKAKGLEYPCVVHLDPWLLGETQQEKNLSYVISTRSSDQLYEVNSQDVIV